MWKYIVKRILLMIPVILGVITIVFILSEITPGDPVNSILGADATDEAKAMLTAELGLDQPVFVQYVNYIWRLISQGSLGMSYMTKQEIMGEILVRFPKTLNLAAWSVLLSLLIGIPTGVIAAIKQYSITDNAVIALSLFFASVPQFWLALMLVLIFSVRLHWLPTSGIQTWTGWILPIFVNAVTSAASNARMTRSSMLEVIRQDYVRTARAKGQKETIVIWRHAFKNALFPIITTVGAQIGSALGGSVTIEKVFALPGLGKYLVDALTNHNSPAVLGGVLFLAVIFSIVNLIVDIAYAFIDPRIMAKYKQGNRREKRNDIDASAKAAA